MGSEHKWHKPPQTALFLTWVLSVSLQIFVAKWCPCIQQPNFLEGMIYIEL